MSIKHYTRRDSATAALRKLGIIAADYSKFITQTTSDGGVSCDLEAAQAYVSGHSKHLPQEDATIKGEITETTSVAKAPKKTAKASADKMPSISAVCRELILAGKTNKEVWDIVQPQFQLSDKKRGYPAWYRTELKNAGKLPK